MSRVKLSIPEKFLGKIIIPVRIGDINYGNHVGNDSFVSILHEARIKWLAQYNFSELDIGGAGLIMSDLTIEFKKEGFYGDIIDVSLYLGEQGTIGFELYYQLFTTRLNESILLVNAKTGMVCYDYKQSKVSAIPAAFFHILAL